MNKPIDRSHAGATGNHSGPATSAADLALRQSLAEQTGVFEAAVSLIERLEAAAHRREAGSLESVGLLRQSLDQVIAAQQKVAAARERFAAAGLALTSELRTALGQHEELLRTLISRIDRLQHVFEDLRSELTPRLDAETRRRSMHAAYQQSLKTL